MVDYILEGGACAVGLESTIVDLSSEAPAILRPGGVTQEALEAVLAQPVPFRTGGTVRSPGQLASHYAPRARVILVSPGELPTQAAALHAQGLRVALLTRQDDAVQPGNLAVFRLPDPLEEAARALYATLRQIDQRGFDAIVVSLPPEKGLGAAIADRLRRAAGPRPGATPGRTRSGNP
jgi:L-threonylcarbamoyladenylate synthase